MSPPSRSPEQRRAALDRAIESRRARAALREQLKSGQLPGSTVLERSAEDTLLGALPVRWFLRSLPGVGPGRADDAMCDLDISAGRRLRGLGRRQHADLRAWLERHEARSPARSTPVPVRAPLVVVSGPSGVGKSTVVREALALAPHAWLSVSATTRAPRPGEIDGRDYCFTSASDFDGMVASGALLEWAEYAGSRYGTPRRPVDEHRALGRPVLLEIEVQGARQVRAAAPDAHLVFIAPPTPQALADRLARRGTEDPAAVERRLDIAREELLAQGEFDTVLVNDDVHRTAAALVGFLGDAAAP